MARYSETDTLVSDRHRRSSLPPQRRPLNPAASIFTVTPDPNSIGAAWTFTGSDGYSHAGTGDEALSDLAIGDYTSTRSWRMLPPITCSGVVQDGNSTLGKVKSLFR